jgi:hypothetical protein
MNVHSALLRLARAAALSAALAAAGASASPDAVAGVARTVMAAGARRGLFRREERAA